MAVLIDFDGIIDCDMTTDFSQNFASYIIDRDINKAIHYLSLAANHNYQKALFDLGCIYYTGQSVKKDINKAFHYFQLSAFQENDYAQFNLGLINLKGIEVQKDIEQFLI